MIREKRLLALGMGSSKRSAALPELPTTLELGVPNSDYNFWVGLFAPAGTPREIVRSSMPRPRGRSRARSCAPACRSSAPKPTLVEPDAYNLQLKKEIADNAAVVKAAGIPIGGAQ